LERKNAGYELYHFELNFCWLCRIVYVLGWSAKNGRQWRDPEDFRRCQQIFNFFLFYSNPNDPRGWLPKPTGIGLTVNFRKQVWIYLFIFFIFGSLASASLLIYSVCFP
jgi:uncharacterized membrane protein